MKRLTQLDGLRGIAAVVVVLSHLSLIAKPFLGSGNVGDAWWWMSRTPLALATAGTQSVLVFFILSGLVVALPALRKGFSWTKYYSSRFVRLYVPAWGALAVAAILVFLVPRDDSNVSSGEWISQTNAHTNVAVNLLADASLMKVGFAADNVLWSLRWEIVFSLLLPLFVLAAVLLRRSWFAFALAAAGCVALTIGDPDHANATFYLPVFMMGTLIASRLEAIQEWSRRRSRTFWVVVFCASLFFLIASQLFAFAVPGDSALGGILWSLVGVGAAGLILSAIGFGPFRTFLNGRVSQFLGRISFSLYLVHVPILATLAFAIGDTDWWLVGILGVPVSIGCAVVFYRFVELPSQRLAHRIGAGVVQRQTPRQATVREPAHTESVERAPQVEYARGAVMPHYAAMR